MRLLHHPPPQQAIAWSASWMRAATIREQEVVIEEHADPVAHGEEVLLRVHAAGLNGGGAADATARPAPAPPGSPQDIPAWRLAGEVGAGAEGRTLRGEARDGDRRRRRPGRVRDGARAQRAVPANVDYRRPRAACRRCS